MNPSGIAGRKILTQLSLELAEEGLQASYDLVNKALNGRTLVGHKSIAKYSPKGNQKGIHYLKTIPPKYLIVHIHHSRRGYAITEHNGRDFTVLDSGLTLREARQLIPVSE